MTEFYSDQSIQILENMSDAYFSVDAEWKVLYANRRAEWYWGIGRNELIGHLLWDVFPPDKLLKGVQEMTRSMQNRTPASFETFSPVVKGYVEVNSYPNKFGGIDVYFHNITDRRMAEDARQTNDQMLRLAIDATGIGFWEWDLITDRFTTIYCSPNMPTEWHDGTLEETLATVHPDDRSGVLKALMDAKRTDRRYLCEYRRVLPDGAVVWIDARGEIIHSMQGQPVRLLGINRDVTEQKRKQRQEELLREAEEMALREKELLEILDAASDGSWIIDVSKKLKTSSDEWKKLRGSEGFGPHEDFLLEFEAIHPEDREYVRASIREAFASRLDRGELEYRMKTASGDHIWVLSRAKLTYHPDGTPHKMYGVSTDVSRRKEMERVIRDKNQLVLSFLANVSQEFKTPLTVLLLALDLFESHFEQANCQSGARLARDYKVVRQNVYRMQKLVNNLLDITRLDAGLMGLRVVRSDVAELVRELVEAVRGTVFSRNITIGYDRQGEALVAPMDPDKLRRILLNLLTNAVKFSRPGGHIGVGLKMSGSGVLLSVKDDGPGIPAEIQGVLFERFRQLDRPMTRDKEGCCVGLALTKALVELLGGRIWFQTSPGAGTEFFVELPVLSEESTRDSFVVESMQLNRVVEMEFSDVLLQ